jgi:hypothetical protein
MTVMVESDAGVTHSPPMKKRSVCWIGADTPAEMDIRGLLRRRSWHAGRVVDMSPARIVVSM